MNTQTFAGKMYVSRRTAARWASQGIARATKKNGAWVFDEGEPERLKYEQRVACFMEWHNVSRDHAECLAYVSFMGPEEREQIKISLRKVNEAADMGMDTKRFNDLIDQGRLEKTRLEDLIAECMPSQA